MPRVLLGLLLIAGCTPSGPRPVALDLVAMVPTGDVRLGWSPKGEKLVLDADGRTSLTLGLPGQAPIGIRLMRSESSDYYDELWLDLDGDGDLDTSPLTTVPSETRGKIWSSFDAVLPVTAVDPAYGEMIANPYPVSFWYVFDPLEEPEEHVIRFSRRGWMQGDGVVDGIPVRVMLTESVMDGVFDAQDSWALAAADSADSVLGFRAARDADRHAWLGEVAYRLVSIDPSGLRVEVQSGDVGITRAEEEAQEDKLAVDRAADRSGRTVSFEASFEEALSRAQAENKPLFVDFKTVWCGPCHTMDEWVFTADTVVEAASNLVAARVDGDERRDLAKRYGIEAYPTLLLLDSDGRETRRHVGYLNVDSTAIFMTTGR